MSYTIVTSANGAFVAFPSNHSDAALDYFNDHAGPDARIDFAVSAQQLKFYATKGA